MFGRTKTIDNSSLESKHFGLNIGRGYFDRVDKKLIYADIISNRFDVCRLKVDSGDHQAMLALHDLGFPVFYAGSVIRYEITAEELREKLPFPSDPLISYEIYDGSQRHVIDRILDETWQKDPIGYYKTPWISHMISPRKELEYIKDYYGSMTRDPNKIVMLQKYDGQYTAFANFEISGDTLDTAIVAMKPEFRQRNLFHFFMRERFRYALEKGVKKVTCGARIDNTLAQYIFEKHGMRKTGSYHIFHIIPLLTLTYENASVYPYGDENLSTLEATVDHIIRQIITETEDWFITFTTMVLSDKFDRDYREFDLESFLSGEDYAGKYYISEEKKYEIESKRKPQFMQFLTDKIRPKKPYRPKSSSLPYKIYVHNIVFHEDLIVFVVIIEYSKEIKLIKYYQVTPLIK